MTPTAPVALPAAQALKESPRPALRRLTVEETDSAVVITGRVSSYYLKQLAQETVRPLCGVRQLVNRVVVAKE
jgi:hypothetical protein